MYSLHTLYKQMKYFIYLWSYIILKSSCQSFATAKWSKLCVKRHIHTTGRTHGACVILFQPHSKRAKIIDGGKATFGQGQRRVNISHAEFSSCWVSYLKVTELFISMVEFKCLPFSLSFCSFWISDSFWALQKKKLLNFWFCKYFNVTLLHVIFYLSDENYLN